MKEISRVVNSFKESIFSTITDLADENDAINLSQGLPDFDGPEWIKDLAKDAIDQGYNQTPSAIGILSLRKALKSIYQENYSLSYDFNREITITNGATEAIFSTIIALINPGDEVIVFEPFFDTYIPSIQLAGGIPVLLTLRSPDFNIDLEELERAFSDKTKLVILNTPHNPTGRVFTLEEIRAVSNLVIKFNTYLLSDEVYEFLTFDNNYHIPPATISGMHERTITISSAGKTFGFTGWRVGWALANPILSHAIRMVHQNNIFSTVHSQQVAVAHALERINEYVPELRDSYKQKRDFLLNGLREAGFCPITPQGTYFIYCPIAPVSSMSDVEYCMELIKNKKLAAIPPSAFYQNSQEGNGHLRFCFAKKQETLEKAVDILKS